MFARVVTVQIQPEVHDEASQFYRDSVGAALKEQKGFHSTRLLVDRASSKCLMVTLWESEADMKASEASGFLKEQLGHLGRFFASPPNIDRFEIMVQLMA
jgi:heme-degrading monooxygenase HmoA